MYTLEKRTTKGIRTLGIKLYSLRHNLFIQKNLVLYKTRPMTDDVVVLAKLFYTFLRIAGIGT